MTTSVYNGHEIDTTELDKRVACKEPREGEFDRFLAWLRDKGIELILGDYEERYMLEGGRGREVPIADSLLRRIADEVLEGATACGSSELGEIMEAWEQEGMGRCRWLGARCAYPKSMRYDALAGKKVPEQLPAGWYIYPGSIERVLEEFYDLDRRLMDREQAAVMRAIRSSRKVEATV